MASHNRVQLSVSSSRSRARSVDIQPRKTITHLKAAFTFEIEKYVKGLQGFQGAPVQKMEDVWIL